MDKKKKIAIGLSVTSGMAVLAGAITGVVGAENYKDANTMRFNQFQTANNMHTNFINLTTNPSREKFDSLMTQIMVNFSPLNGNYKSVCNYVEKMQDSIDVEDLLTEEQLNQIQAGIFTEEQFNALGSKEKDAVNLYTTQLVIQSVETYSNLDDRGFSATNKEDAYNYYTNSYEDFAGYTRDGVTNIDINSFKTLESLQERLSLIGNILDRPLSPDARARIEKDYEMFLDKKLSINSETGWSRDAEDKNNYITGSEFGPDGYNKDGVDINGNIKEEKLR